MIEKTLSKLEAAIRKFKAADAGKKTELARLVAALRAEIAGLEKTHAEHAGRIAGLTEAAARAATRPRRSPTTVRAALDSLSESARQFESSHPGLARAVAELCRELASIGI